MTTLARTATVPAPRRGGAARRLLVGVAWVVGWAAAAFCLGTGVLPQLDGVPTPAADRVVFVVLGLVLAVLPVLLVWLPERRRVRRAVEAILVVAAQEPAPDLPPVQTWAGPERMFRRLQWSSYSYVAIPLLLLVGGAVAFGLLLDEPVAGGVSALLALVPVAFTVATATLPRRLRTGVRAGVEAGQVVRVAVAHRIDQKLVLNEAFQSWFDASLPDGQRLVLRTPLHFTWAADARGVVDSPDLVLVLGKGGRQGLLLVPARPQDAVWLLGPVPQVRVPRPVQRAFAQEALSA